MDRLTYKSKESDMVWFVDHENDDMKLEPCEMSSHHSRLAIDKLSAYEDAEDQGLLLKLPCKVGDTVYVDSKTITTKNMEFEEVKEVPLFLEAKVVSFRQNCNGNYIKLKVKAKWLHEWVDPDCGPDSAYYETEKYFTYPVSAIGKTVFLTQEKAEEALKKMKETE